MYVRVRTPDVSRGSSTFLTGSATAGRRRGVSGLGGREGDVDDCSVGIIVSVRIEVVVRVGNWGWGWD